MMTNKLRKLFYPSHVFTDCYSITGLRPRTAVAQKLVTICVLPLLLGGVLGAKTMHDQLVDYLRKILMQGAAESQGAKNSNEAVDAVRFLWFVFLTQSLDICYFFG